MTHGSITIASFATIDHTGIVTTKARSNWEADQNGPQDIRRAQVLSTAYVAFGKLNLPDKLAFSAASLALRNSPAPHDNHLGVFLAIPAGSFSTDCLYRDSVEQGNPSPALFSATLPSSPVADIAIYHHLTGPNIVFAGGDSPFVAALRYVTLMLQCGRLAEALIVFIDEPVTANLTVPADQITAVPVATALLLRTSSASLPAELSYEPVPADTSLESPMLTDTQLCTALTRAMEKSSSVRLPVCGGGFRGYICLKLN